MRESGTDLRSYLRVLWQKKWIIISVFVAVVAVAAIILFRLPDQYEAQALLRLRALPPLEKIQLKNPSLQRTAEITQSDEVLLQVAKEIKTPQSGLSSTNPLEIEQWLKQSLKVSVLEKAELIELSLRGSLATEELSAVLVKIIALTESQQEAELKAEAEAQLTFLSNSVLAYDEQLKTLNEQLQTEIANRKHILEGQRKELQQRIDEIRGNPQFLKLQVGEQNATLQGALLKQEFATLNQRLLSIESELQQLDSQGRSLFPDINARFKDLEEGRINLLTLVSRDRQAMASNWKTVSVVSAPYASEFPVGPKRLLNLLIAGILGTLLGMFLALFSYYLQASVARPAEK
ncbi:hypothetical protein HYR54_13405 [Candidatus Acetothermia bacterium]|nr:hypothetical protein [Candidatus Acetothermia bacterium]